MDAIHHRQGEILSRQIEIDLAIKRLHVEPLIGEFVSITDPGHEAKRLQPKAGDVGRLRKVEGRLALIDFGDELRSWFIPCLEGYMSPQLETFAQPDSSPESFMRCPTCQGTKWRHVRYKTPEIIEIACVACEPEDTK
jgi:hypothetical protein